MDLFKQLPKSLNTDSIHQLENAQYVPSGKEKDVENFLKINGLNRNISVHEIGQDNFVIAHQNSNESHFYSYG